MILICLLKNKIGPSLANILNRKIGSLSGYKYSKTLINMDKEWDVTNLYYFLEKPKEWAVGTKMSYRGISDSTKLINTIKYLRENSLRMKIKPIILSGGAGKRLWPLSTENRPKQFFDIFNKKINLFEETLNRTKNSNFDKPIIISNKNHRFNI